MAGRYVRCLFGFLLVVLFCGQSHAYLKAGAGLVHYPEWGCAAGLWYQCNQIYTLDLTAPTFSFGIGKRYTDWSLEVSYVYLGQLDMYSVWEADATYFNGGGGVITGEGRSTGKFHGIEFSGLYHFTDDLYGKIGAFGFEGTWNTHHVDLYDNVGSRHLWHVRRTRVAPVIGGGLNLSDRTSLELTYFPNISMGHGAGVEDAVTVAIVGRW